MDAFMGRIPEAQTQTPKTVARFTRYTPANIPVRHYNRSNPPAETPTHHGAWRKPPIDNHQHPEVT